MHVTEREILIGLISAIEALAERLTGERLEVKFTDGDGNFMWTRPSGTAVRWISEEVERGHFASPVGCRAMQH
jgi:hypothetical protein